MLIISLIIFVGVFVQTVSGFGLGLVAMPLLSAAVGLEVARPLMVLVAVSTQAVVIARTYRSISFSTVGVLAALGLLGIPFGNWVAEAQILSEDMLLAILATIITTYSLYALLSPTLPKLHNDRYSGVAGLLSGILTGAYNVGGPPVVIYADARRWTPDAVRSNLQSFFLMKGVMLVGVHALSQNFTGPVLSNYLWAVPAMIAGLVVGFLLYGRINAARFRQVVLVLLLLTGLSILHGVLFGA